MSAKEDIKGFYKQKKSAIVAKPKAKSTASSTKKSAAFGSNVTQPPALISHGSPDLQDEHDSKENILRQFDLNMAYGPCIGMSRLARWERAKVLGLNPPEGVKHLLTAGKGGAECLWDGCV